jgi:DegV family protein with EDD domain
MIKIVTDSTSDIPIDIATQLGITVVPVVIVIDTVSHVDGITISRQQFYDNLENYRDVPRTASPPMETFANAFRTVQREGADDIIAIHLNQRFSVLYSVVDLAAREVSHEGIRVHVIDSQTLSMGLGWLAIVAARMARDGASVSQITRHIEALRTRAYIYALVDNLKFLRNGGRANALTAGIGDLLQVKILLQVHAGEVSQIDRIRTHARGVARLLEVAHQHKQIQHLSLLYTSNGMESEIEALKAHLSDLVAQDDLLTVQVAPVIGAHVGPFTMGIAMFADV